MSSPYVGEIRIFAGNFAPLGWHLCNGAVLAIAENSTLFNLIGTTYGGDGQSTFGLPDLCGRVPAHTGVYQGQTFQFGESGGVETVTLQPNQIPVHTHAFRASSSVADTADPSQAFIGSSSQVSVFLGEPPGGQSVMNTGMLAPAGGSQPHENMQSFLCVNFIISLFGVYPSTT